jgi:uncharacterized protein YcfL
MVNVLRIFLMSALSLLLLAGCGSKKEETSTDVASDSVSNSEVLDTNAEDVSASTNVTPEEVMSAQTYNSPTVKNEDMEAEAKMRANALKKAQAQ